MHPRVSVAVFAYNEEACIAACLAALAACANEAALSIYVLVNGCTDATGRIVRAIAADDPAIVPVVIARGDKANAWNHYVHEVAPMEAAMHVFTDGDMEVARGSIAGMLRTFADAPEANGCAGLPVSGRSRCAFRDKLQRNRELAGNLYGLRGTFVARIRERGVRLPFGLFGEDGLVGSLTKYDLDFRGPFDDRRVTWCAQAGFGYRSLDPWRPAHWRILRNRMMRYAVRRQQANLLYPLLREGGTEAMPRHVIDLYRARGAALRLGWNGLESPFDWIAVRRIRRDIRLGERGKAEERAHLYS